MRLYFKIFAPFAFGFFMLNPSNLWAASVPYAVDAGQSSTDNCKQETCPSSNLGYSEDASLQSSAAACASKKSVCYNSYSSSGITVSLASYKDSCVSCPSGYALKLVTDVSTRARDCEVTYYVCENDPLADCPSNCKSTSWITDKNQTGRQTRCNTSEGKCEYRCISGYYNGSSLTSGTYCKACPANATCPMGSTRPVCDRGYYPQKTNDPASGGIGISVSYTYTCPRCPAVTGSNPAVYGTTPLNTSVIGITACYIPANTTINVTEGKYQFTQNCNYSNTATVTPGKPVGTVGE